MKYALVTGGSRGIGRAISIQLARDGYYVIINYKSNHEAAQETLSQIQNEGGQAELLPFDVSKPQAIKDALDSWQQAHPDEYIEVLVNNAGIVHPNILMEMEPNEWHSVVDTALNGFYYVTHWVLPEMVIHHNGRIINMSSLLGIIGIKGNVNHATAKAALIGATKSLAVEMASKKVTVNAVAPGAIETSVMSISTKKEAIQHIPMQRLGEPEEVADLVSFLVSDRAAYITGQVIGINGGLGV